MRAAICIGIFSVLLSISMPAPKLFSQTVSKRLPTKSSKTAHPMRSSSKYGAATSILNTVIAGEGSLFAAVRSIAAQEVETTVVAGYVVDFRDPIEKICSVNVVDWNLSAILRTLSEQTGSNLLLLSNPGAKLTIRLADLPLADILRHLCALSNLRCLKVGKAYVIATEDQLKKGYPKEWENANPAPPPQPTIETPKPVSRAHRLSYVSAAQAASVLTKLFGEGKLGVAAGPGPSSPALTVRDAEQVTGLASGAIQKTGADSSDSSKIVVIWGPPDLVEAAEAMLIELDQPRPQVVISVTIYDINNDALKELGLTWTIGGVSISESNPQGLNFGSFSRTGTSFAAAIKALETKNQAKMLANPTISVLDNEKAFILIGQRINYPVLVGFTQANTPIFSREQERVGIYLQVATNVSEQGEITLVLYPQVSTVTGFLEVNGASYPQIATREAQTTLRLRDGESIVMGGLLKDEEVVDIQKVPFLSDIPIFGELFKRRKATKTTSQVIISIKTELIKPKTP